LLGILNFAKGIDKMLHHDEFDIDEHVLKLGTVFYATFALDFLNS